MDSFTLTSTNCLSTPWMTASHFLESKPRQLSPDMCVVSNLPPSNFRQPILRKYFKRPSEVFSTFHVTFHHPLGPLFAAIDPWRHVVSNQVLTSTFHIPTFQNSPFSDHRTISALREATLDQNGCSL